MKMAYTRFLHETNGALCKKKKILICLTSTQSQQNHLESNEKEWEFKPQVALLESVWGVEFKMQPSILQMGLLWIANNQVSLV